MYHDNSGCSKWNKMAGWQESAFLQLINGKYGMSKTAKTNELDKQTTIFKGFITTLQQTVFFCKDKLVEVHNNRDVQFLCK